VPTTAGIFAEPYECGLADADAPFLHEIVGRVGVMLALTYAADPYSDDLDRQLRDALRDGRVLFGWVPLSRR
jgi:hypothetical protein